MPKKRSRDCSQDRIDRYQRKIEKIEEHRRRKRRRRTVIESESESDCEPQMVSQIQTGDTNAEVDMVAPSLTEPPLIEGSKPEELLQTPPVAEIPTDPELNPELLLALGEETGNTPNFGEKIHHNLSQRWEPILKKGLTKESKDKLLKEYLIPENCTLLQAPKLNNEVAAAISEAARHRDKRKQTEQQQLGVGISALSKALTLMLTGDNKLEAIRIITDGCRILTDLHFQETQARTSVINYSLAKPFLNIVQDGERDETLYGNKLGEKIKASKTIEKQGLSIKKFVKTPKNTQIEAIPSTSRPQYTPPVYQGNWMGPPRYPSIRGGRRGGRRTSTPIVNRRPPFPSPNTAGPSKPRMSAPR